MITQVEDYFNDGCGRCKRFATTDCSVRKWSRGLQDLRFVCQNTGLVETVKWGHPCYVLGDRNIAIIGAFRDDFRLTFFNSALMKDVNGLFEKQGPNSRESGVIRFLDQAQVLKLKPILHAYLLEAMTYAAAGLKPPKLALTIELPQDLIAALKDDPELAEHFYKLTAGRQKSYVINVGSAKTAETRVSRIQKFRSKIIAGKGAFDR